MKIERDFEEFLKLLNKNNVKYAIIGAFALAIYSKLRINGGCGVALWSL
jgi:hypothetical protein